MKRDEALKQDNERYSLGKNNRRSNLEGMVTKVGAYQRPSLENDKDVLDKLLTDSIENSFLSGDILDKELQRDM